MITQESFDQLLAWLDPDREQAGKKYEQIRRSLIKIFTWRGINEAEDLADETINRVAQKFPELSATYVGEPALYFHAVARNVQMQYLQRKRRLLLPPPPSEEEVRETEKASECLERCLQRLTPTNREIILRYYRAEKQAKINDRRALAKRLGVAATALRVRAHRIRETLHECVRACLEDQSNTHLNRGDS